MSTTSFLILIACLLLAAKCAGWLCQRVGIPSVLGQLLIGVLIGPSLLGWAHPEPLTDSFASIGVIILMFLAGLETDMKQMRKVGGTAFVSASLGVIVPFIVGAAFAYALGYSLPISLFLLRVSAETELAGLDIPEMGSLGYAPDAEPYRSPVPAVEGLSIGGGSQ